EASAGNLQSLYQFVRDSLKPVDSGETPWKFPVLLVDNLSVLLSLGLEAVAVLDFMQYCRATVCCELKQQCLSNGENWSQRNEAVAVTTTTSFEALGTEVRLLGSKGLAQKVLDLPW
ncbi:putative UPF0405 protein C3orf75 like protein, partial [Cricetulus griseus]